MPWPALALVLLAAVLHALWNIAAKRAGGDGRFVVLSSALMALLWLPPGLWLAWTEVPRWGPAHWGALLASALVHLAYYRSLLAGYRAADLTVVYPLARGSGPLLTALAAVLLLGETMSATGAAGVAAVCLGVFTIAGGPALWRGGGTPEAQARRRAGLRWGLATGALIATYSVIDGIAIQWLAMAPLVYDWMNNVLRTALQLPGNIFSDQLRIGVRLRNLFNLNLYRFVGQITQLAAQILHRTALTTNHNTWTSRMNGYLNLIGKPLDLQQRNTSRRHLLHDEFADGKILMQTFFVLLPFCKPTRIPIAN